MTVHGPGEQKVEKYRRLIGVPGNFPRGHCQSASLEWVQRLLQLLELGLLRPLSSSWTGAGRPLETVRLSRETGVLVSLTT